MRIGWIGVHQEGVLALQAVCKEGYKVTGLLTLDSNRAKERSGSVDYKTICNDSDIPIFFIKNINDVESLRILNSLNCDLLVVLGWGQILGPEALGSAKIGVVGTHASLLPHNRGSAPVNWSIIRGEQLTGNSLIWLNQSVDTGDLIDQKSFQITPFDTCFSIYQKVARTNREMLLDLCKQLLNGDRPGKPQKFTNEPVLPRRRPRDGRIDWNSSTRQIYDMIRGLTRPYPGAFGEIKDDHWKLWNAAFLDLRKNIAPPGTPLGPVWSPEASACGQLIATGDGAILLLEVESPDGEIYSHRKLCALAW